MLNWQMDKALFSPLLPQRTMKSLEHEQEKPHLSSVKVITSDVGPEKSSSELNLFRCICLLWVFAMLCTFIGVVCWSESFVVSQKLVSVWISVLYLHAWLTRAVLLSAVWSPTERIRCGTVPSFTGVLAALKRDEKSFYVHFFLPFSPQAYKLSWWRSASFDEEAWGHFHFQKLSRLEGIWLVFCCCCGKRLGKSERDVVFDTCSWLVCYVLIAGWRCFSPSLQTPIPCHETKLEVESLGLTFLCHQQQSLDSITACPFLDLSLE